MKARKYYLDNSVESLLIAERQKFNNSGKYKILEFIATTAVCSLAVVVAVYIGKMLFHLPEALNSL